MVVINNVHELDYHYLRVERLEHMAALGGTRVHAAAFGFSRPSHVMKPLAIMDADAFFLLENQDDKAYKYHLKRKVNVHKLLDRSKIPWERVEVDLWEPASVGGALQQIVRKHGLKELWVNASVGPNTVTVGAALASLFAPIRLFHPGGRRPHEPLERLEDVRTLPTLKLPDWTPRHVAILDALHACKGEASGTVVKQWLRQNRPQVIGRGGGSAENWAQAEHSKFQALLDPLRRASALTYTTAHRRWTIKLEPAGEQLRQLLAGLR